MGIASCSFTLVLKTWYLKPMSTIDWQEKKHKKRRKKIVIFED